MKLAFDAIFAATLDAELLTNDEKGLSVFPDLEFEYSSLKI